MQFTFGSPEGRVQVQLDVLPERFLPDSFKYVAERFEKILF